MENKKKRKKKKGKVRTRGVFLLPELELEMFVLEESIDEVQGIDMLPIRELEQSKQQLQLKTHFFFSM